ncbi:acyl-CoA dehydrogenase family protein [Pendulispora albinea]|uniref:Acyl-CoA dehydrogenase n=1 Tax=Pendulispora albinea TaxID=2741071 RepID=A0ABZ2M7U4_9BACT
MDFQFTEEQKQLRDVLDRFIAKEYGFETRRQIVKEPLGFRRATWEKFAELGLLGLTIPEAHGGFGGGAVDTLLVMEAFGRGLVVEPYLSSVVLSGGLLRELGNEAQKSELLPAIAAGQKLFAFAHYEQGSRYELEHVSARAARKGPAQYALTGKKTVVLHGGSADRFIVSARTSGEAGDAEGISLFLVDARAPGVSLRDYPTQDGQRAAEVALDAVTVADEARLGEEGRALPGIERVVDFAIAALCAEAVGCMGALNAQTLEYVKTRKQFGVPIGKFQVLQHRMADMFIHTEQARSMSYLAAVKVHASDPAERRRALSAAKALVGQSSRFVGQQAIQLHGGMGVTDELEVSHHFKRLTAINLTFGDAEHHLARFSDQMERRGRVDG